jgi:hypothetical protein
MKFDRKYRISEVAGTDPTRPHLTCVYLDTAKKRMHATNGHALAFVPCTVDANDRDGAVNAEAIREARRAKQPEIKARKRILDVNNKVMYRRPRTESPPVDQAAPQFKYGDKETVSVTLNPHLLVQLANAIGRGEIFRPFVTLTWKPSVEYSGIVVSAEGEDAWGVIMPARR